jgi:hypothetical protein
MRLSDDKKFLNIEAVSIGKILLVTKFEPHMMESVDAFLESLRA